VDVGQDAAEGDTAAGQVKLKLHPLHSTGSELAEVSLASADISGDTAPAQPAAVAFASGADGAAIEDGYMTLMPPGIEERRPASDALDEDGRPIHELKGSARTRTSFKVCDWARGLLGTRR
jgi:hypothetical protein